MPIPCTLLEIPPPLVPILHHSQVLPILHSTLYELHNYTCTCIVHVCNDWEAFDENQRNSVTITTNPCCPVSQLELLLTHVALCQLLLTHVALCQLLLTHVALCQLLLTHVALCLSCNYY